MPPAAQLRAEILRRALEGVEDFDALTREFLSVAWSRSRDARGDDRLRLQGDLQRVALLSCADAQELSASAHGRMRLASELREIGH